MLGLGLGLEGIPWRFRQWKEHCVRWKRPEENLRGGPDKTGFVLALRLGTTGEDNGEGEGLRVRGEGEGEGEGG